MKIIEAKSCKDLFVKCIILSIVINIFFYLISIFVSEITAYVILECIQICFNFCGGLIIRKNNQDILIQKPLERKKYTNITLIGFIFLLIIICEPDVIVMPYTYIIVLIYNTFGLDHLLTFFDYASIIAFLAPVFFTIPSKTLHNS